MQTNAGVATMGEWREPERVDGEDNGRAKIIAVSNTCYDVPVRVTVEGEEKQRFE